MPKTFAALKTEAQNAKSAVDLVRIHAEAKEKIDRNIAKAQMLSFTPGRAVEASNYFQNLIPGWSAIVSEIAMMMVEAVRHMPDAERKAVFAEAYGR